MAEDSKKSPKKMVVGALFVGGALAVEGLKKRDDRKYQEKVRKEKGGGIAFKGEKVIAIEDVDGHGIDDNIINGKIYTVRSYSLLQDCYQLQELDILKYDPYLGEYDGQWFSSKHFKKID